MPREIAIIDYGMGNLRSVQKGLERVGARAELTRDPGQVRSAPAVVLPGVGAFGAAMQELKRLGLVEPLRERGRCDRPFLGVCLGLQLLFERSNEDGLHLGLGLLPGAVTRFPVPPPSDAATWKIPHMGWNTVRVVNANPLLTNLADGTRFYFVHSYYALPARREDVALETEYAGVCFAAMVRRGNLFATQFHPEKSQALGLELLRKFVEL